MRNNGLILAWPFHRFGPEIISQRFGDNPANYARFDLPGHDGLDFAVPFGEPVLAPAEGFIFESDSQVRRGYGHNYGRHLRIKVAAGGYEYHVVLCHLASVCVWPGDSVAAGQVIGLAGNSGNVRPAPTSERPDAGTHLHLTLKRIGAGATGWPYGLVDPEPFLTTGAGR